MKVIIQYSETYQEIKSLRKYVWSANSILYRRQIVSVHIVLFIDTTERVVFAFTRLNSLDTAVVLISKDCS